MKNFTTKFTLFSVLSLVTLPLFSADWEKLQLEMMEMYATRVDLIPHIKNMTSSKEHENSTTFVYKRTLTPEQKTDYDTAYAQAEKRVYQAYIAARKTAFNVVKETTVPELIGMTVHKCCAEHFMDGNLTDSYIINAAIAEANGKVFVPSTVVFGAHLFAHNRATKCAEHSSCKSQIAELTAKNKTALTKIATIKAAAKEREKELTAKIQTITEKETQRAQTENLSLTLHAARQASADKYYAKKQAEAEQKEDEKTATDKKDLHDAIVVAAAQPDPQKNAQRKAALLTADEEFHAVLETYALPPQGPFNPYAPAHVYIDRITTSNATDSIQSFDAACQGASARAYIDYMISFPNDSFQDSFYAKAYRRLAFERYLKSQPTHLAIPEIDTDAANAYADAALAHATIIGKDIIVRKKSLAALVLHENIAAVRKAAANKFHAKKLGELIGNEAVAAHLSIRSEARSITDTLSPHQLH